MDYIPKNVKNKSFRIIFLKIWFCYKKDYIILEKEWGVTMIRIDRKKIFRFLNKIER